MFARASRAAAIVLLLLVACTGRPDTNHEGQSATGPRSGGTLRVAVPTDYVHQIVLDPQRAYIAPSWELFRCCLLRTLYSYNGRPSEQGGNELRPDLAAGMPQVSSDDLTWTFHLRPGITYGPPFADVPVVAGDVVRALERVARFPRDFAIYYGAIRGFSAFQNGSSDSIAGLETPDDRTLVVRLDRPVGSLAYRFSFAATAPIPEGADAKDLGGLLAPTGPYMIQGSGDLDPSIPADQRGLPEGLVPADIRHDSLVSPGSITLVRNPSWRRSTDRLRAAYADRIEITLGGDGEEIAHRVDAGDLDLGFAQSSPARQVARYRSDPNLRGRLFVNPADSEWAVSMNLALSPFDDVHVRRAVNLAIDKQELVEMTSHPPYGLDGQSSGEVATHLAPDALEGGLLDGITDPYAHDLARAADEMRQSVYDRNHDGRCDAAQCRDIPALVMGYAVIPDVARAIAHDLEPLGIELNLDTVDTTPFFRRLYDPSARTPIAIVSPWGKDLPVGDGWFGPLFTSNALGGANSTLLGANPAQLHQWGYPAANVPSVDDRVLGCGSDYGSSQTACWAQLDQYLMQNVVPWVPLLWPNATQVVSERVVAFSFDQFANQPSLDRIALKPGTDA